MENNSGWNESGNEKVIWMWLNTPCVEQLFFRTIKMHIVVKLRPTQYQYRCRPFPAYVSQRMKKKKKKRSMATSARLKPQKQAAPFSKPQVDTATPLRQLGATIPQQEMLAFDKEYAAFPNYDTRTLTRYQITRHSRAILAKSSNASANYVLDEQGKTSATRYLLEFSPYFTYENWYNYDNEHASMVDWSIAIRESSNYHYTQDNGLTPIQRSLKALQLASSFITLDECCSIVMWVLKSQIKLVSHIVVLCAGEDGSVVKRKSTLANNL